MESGISFLYQESLEHVFRKIDSYDPTIYSPISSSNRALEFQTLMNQILERLPLNVKPEIIENIISFLKKIKRPEESHYFSLSLDGKSIMVPISWSSPAKLEKKVFLII